MKILGLDLGTSSIGWSLVEETEHTRNIIAMGSRVIPLSTEDKDEFSSGNTISKNQKRTTKRTQRKGYDRYQLRRSSLQKELEKAGMLPDDTLMKLDALVLWELRAKAVSEKIELRELGRVLLHINQKRGYKSARKDSNKEKKDTDYVAEVKSRHQELVASGLTLGQFFYERIKADRQYRIKQRVYPREAYISEFDMICANQKQYWSTVLTDSYISTLRNEIIFYQRKLKSQKGLVNICEFEGFTIKKETDGIEKKLFVGPRVAPRTSPLFQVAKIWETINNITIRNRRNDLLPLSAEQKQDLFAYLNTHDRMSEKVLFDKLKIKESDGWYGNKQIETGLQGNKTITQFLRFLPIDSKLLEFNLIFETHQKVDTSTGEIREHKIVSPAVIEQPLYKLWHAVYSIEDEANLLKVLKEQFGLEPELAKQITEKIDFASPGFGNKSAKAIRKMLPYLADGLMYNEAAAKAGYNHSNSLTKDEAAQQKIVDQLELLPKNSLRQPVVEKILNQLINLVNSIIDERQGWVSKEERLSNQFEIRIELARELKQSKDERNATFSELKKIERENDNIRKRISEEYSHLGIRPNRANVIKWRLFHEINNEESKLNATCIYCGQHFGLSDALSGNSIDVEHIIPKSLLFDDSQSNKTLSHRSCNEEKKDRTAFDFMASKGDEALKVYIDRVDKLYRNGIIKKGKRNKLLTPGTKIPADFISRQLGETRYIARKAQEILGKVSRQVTSTTGAVTAYLRNKWGWDDVTMNLQLPKYKAFGLAEVRRHAANDGSVVEREVIKGWTKRSDHRHHALDALVVACTRQSFIQRLNTLNAQHTREQMREEISQYRSRLSLLDNFIISKRPFTTQQVQEAVSRILISFKAGKKTTATGSRKIRKAGKSKVVQKGILIPRGALSEESVYGKIKAVERNKPVKYLFENPHLIFKPYIKALVEKRLAEHNGDVKMALRSLKTVPIYLDEAKSKMLQYGTCYQEVTVIRKPVEQLNEKQVKDIIDPVVRRKVEERIAAHNGNIKEAFKNLQQNPIWFNEAKRIPIKTVRWNSGLAAVEPIKSDSPSLGFVKPGNNHHLAFYRDQQGVTQAHVCSFWHAVERKKFKIPVVITSPTEIWTDILKQPERFPQQFLNKLPHDDWTLIESLQVNEMFVLGMNLEMLQNAIRHRDIEKISDALYRVQKLSLKGNGQIDFWFRHHLETELDDSGEAKLARRFYNIQSIPAFERLRPIKVRVNNLGAIMLA